MSGVHLRVEVGGEQYALAVESVLEVAEVGVVAPVPGASAEVIGVRNLRGQVIPVIDLATVLGLQSRSLERIVVAEHGDRRAALAVASVIDVAELPEAAEEVESPLLIGAALLEGVLIGVIDVGAVLDSLGPGAPE